MYEENPIADSFDWYKTDDSVKKWTSLPETNECRKNAKLCFVFAAAIFIIIFTIVFSQEL